MYDYDKPFLAGSFVPVVLGVMTMNDLSGVRELWFYGMIGGSDRFSVACCYDRCMLDAQPTRGEF